jgi:manganese oxidase
MIIRQGDRVRIRAGNLTMTNHPIHMHGHEFTVTGTDGGWTPPASRWPEVTTDIAVGQMRAIEFLADEPGDWAFHCHKSHHTMNAMGHDVPTLIGVDQREVLGKINKLVPDYMIMGDKGMADMGEMEMPLPDNTLPMMTGQGPFGGIGMGGMFTTMKVRKGLARNDYKDPGWYQHPPGTVAYELKEGAAAAPAPESAPDKAKMAAKPGEKVMTVTKGGKHHGH